MTIFNHHLELNFFHINMPLYVRLLFRYLLNQEGMDKVNGAHLGSIYLFSYYFSFSPYPYLYLSPIKRVIQAIIPL